jgi:hypothetical protein
MAFIMDSIKLSVIAMLPFSPSLLLALLLQDQLLLGNVVRSGPRVLDTRFLFLKYAKRISNVGRAPGQIAAPQRQPEIVLELRRSRVEFYKLKSI